MEFREIIESDKIKDIQKEEVEKNYLAEKRLDTARDFNPNESLEAINEQKAVEDSDRIRLDAVRKKIANLSVNRSVEARLETMKDFDDIKK